MSDLISRQDVIEIIQSMYPGMPRIPWMRKDWQKRYEPYIRTENAIRKLPSAQPETCVYWDRESNICALHRPSAQSERMKEEEMTIAEAKRMLTRIKDRINFEVTDSQPKMDALNMAIKALSAHPERPKGHWIDTGSGQECSECGEIQYGYDNFRYYCAKCGAEMVKGEAE